MSKRARRAFDAAPDASAFAAPDVERVVLGDLALHPGNAEKYHGAGLTVEDFSDGDNRTVWSVVSDLLARHLEPDWATVTTAARGRGVTPAYIARLIDGIPRQSDQNIVAHVDTLKTHRRCRQFAYGHQRDLAQLIDRPELINNGLISHRVEELRRLDEADPARLRFVNALSLVQAPPPAEVVEGVAWASRVTMMTGASGDGKTFVCADLAAAVASNVPWHGRAVEHGSVGYCSFEGDAFGLRLNALHRIGGHDLVDFHTLHAKNPLSPRITRDGTEEPSIGERELLDAIQCLAADLAEAGRPPMRLVVIDTVRASLVGSEDGSDNTAAYLRAVRRLVPYVPTAAFLLVHHSGWQDGKDPKKRERGSSAWRGNSDASLYLEAEPFDKVLGTARLTVSTVKVRDGEKPDPLHLIRRQVRLLDVAGHELVDKYGRPMTSCVIDSDHRSHETLEAERLAKVETAHCADDLAVLRAMRAYPNATSVKLLRPYVGKELKAVTAAVDRVLRAELATEGKRGQPYVLTEAGIRLVTTGRWPSDPKRN